MFHQIAKKLKTFTLYHFIAFLFKDYLLAQSTQIEPESRLSDSTDKPVINTDCLLARTENRLL